MFLPRSSLILFFTFLQGIEATQLKCGKTLNNRFSDNYLQ